MRGQVVPPPPPPAHNRNSLGGPPPPQRLSMGQPNGEYNGKYQTVDLHLQ